MILFISVLHGIPIIIVAFFTRSEPAIKITAVISLIAGILSGNPSYVLFDILGVGAGFIISLILIDKKAGQPTSTA